MKRTVIKIDEARCTGCGACVEGCHGGALQIIDGKARIINEAYCDGLGACIGTCPTGALTLEERETSGALTPKSSHETKPCCELVGMDIQENTSLLTPTEEIRLRHFPIQLHLINPHAPFLKNTDLVLAADCTAFAYSGFHRQFLKNNSIAIACPKLDNARAIYVEKLTEMIDYASINSLTVIIMEVPCCRGLLQSAQEAIAKAIRKIPLIKVVIGIQGNAHYTFEN